MPVVCRSYVCGGSGDGCWAGPSRVPSIFKPMQVAFCLRSPIHAKILCTEACCAQKPMASTSMGYGLGCLLPSGVSESSTVNKARTLMGSLRL